IRSIEVGSTSSHQQSIADAGLDSRPPMLEKGSYVSWSSPFMRYVDDLESPADAPRMRMYKYSDLTGEEMLRYEADIEAMNWILLGMPNDIYNSVDTCQTAEQMWRQVQRFCTLINCMNHNNLIQNKIVVNTKFLNSLQPEWSKYVTRARQSDTLSQVDYDLLFDYLTQNEPDVNASREKQASRNHDPLALVANAYARYAGSSSRNAGRSGGNQGRNFRNQGITVANSIVQTTAGNAENMLLAAKDEARVHLGDEESDFMLMSANGDDQLE
ncbi:hypothetical protein Tco_0443584, partial [Tanacetum coccineum]